MSAVRPWTYGGRAAYAGHRLVSEGAVAIQAPNRSKGWEIYAVSAFSGLEMFVGYAKPVEAELLTSTLAALLDARSEAA